MSSFPRTRWSLIARAADASTPASRNDMGELLEQYWRPMFVHLKCKGLSHTQAEDVLQDFIVTLLDKSLLSVADPSKGRFRSLLLTALDRFLVSKFRHDSAAKRSPGKVASLDAAEMDVPQVDRQAGLAFERVWALDVLSETMARMEAECANPKDAARWSLFQDRVIGPLLDGSEPCDYEVFASQHGLDNGKAAMNLLVTAKRQFARVMREVIGEYLTRSSQGVRNGAADQRAQSVPKELDLDELQLEKAIELEIADLQRIFWESRGVVDLAAEFHEQPADREPSKSRFFKRFTEHRAEDAGAFSALLQTGSETTDDALTIGFRELLDHPLQGIAAVGKPASGTVGDLLLQPSPAIASLKAVKDWIGLKRLSRSSTTPPPLVNGLYFLTLAAAVTQGARELTGLGDSQLRDGLTTLAAEPWLPPEMRALVSRALLMTAESNEQAS